MSSAESPTWWLTKRAACRKPDLYVAEWGTKLEQQVISRVPKAVWSQEMCQDDSWVLLKTAKEDYMAYTLYFVEKTALFQRYLAFRRLYSGNILLNYS